MVCHREGLLSACQLAGVAVATRDVKPILRNLKAIVEPDRCTLMATDLELGIRLEVRGVKVEEPGDAILPAARTTAILREATDEEMQLDASADACLVRGQLNEFEMPSEDPGHFPDVPAFAEEKYHELTAGPQNPSDLRLHWHDFRHMMENPITENHVERIIGVGYLQH